MIPCSKPTRAFSSVPVLRKWTNARISTSLDSINSFLIIQKYGINIFYTYYCISRSVKYGNFSIDSPSGDTQHTEHTHKIIITHTHTHTTHMKLLCNRGPFDVPMIKNAKRRTQSRLLTIITTQPPLHHDLVNIQGSYLVSLKHLVWTKKPVIVVASVFALIQSFWRKRSSAEKKRRYCAGPTIVDSLLLQLCCANRLSSTVAFASPYSSFWFHRSFWSWRTTERKTVSVEQEQSFHFELLIVDCWPYFPKNATSCFVVSSTATTKQVSQLRCRPSAQFWQCCWTKCKYRQMPTWQTAFTTRWALGNKATKIFTTSMTMTKTFEFKFRCS